MAGSAVWRRRRSTTAGPRGEPATATSAAQPECARTPSAARIPAGLFLMVVARTVGGIVAPTEVRGRGNFAILKGRRGTQVAQGRGLQNLHSWVRIPPAPPISPRSLAALGISARGSHAAQAPQVRIPSLA